MVRASKSPVPVTVSVSESLPLPDVVLSQTAVVKKAKKVKDPVSMSPVQDTSMSASLLDLKVPTVVPDVVPDVVIEGAAPSDVVDAIDTIPSKMNDFGNSLQNFISHFSAIKSKFKLLEKIVVRDFKISQKANSKKNKRSGNRLPSGFVRPTLISEELARFLGKEIGTEMARTSVSKEINLYIRTHELQDKANGRQINADKNLATLLNLKEGDVLTYFNLQRYMKHHFIKTPPTVLLESPSV